MLDNPYLEEMIRRIENRYAIDSKDMSMGDWVCANTTLRGRPFSFDRYPFQKAIVDDMHPNMDVIKPSQVGLSESQVRKSLGILARYRSTALIFTMPNGDMKKRMSQTRIKPIVDEDHVFNLETNSGAKPIRSLDIIQIGTSFMYMTGSTEGDATSTSVDFVMNDEVDLTDQQMLALFNSRLQNSDWKVNQRFSTPTFSGFGIDKGFQVSDQMHYLCRCTACGHWNNPEFDERHVIIPGYDGALLELSEEHLDTGLIDLMNSYVACEKCHAPLDLGGEREWVPKYPSRTHARGYRVHPFSTSRLSVEYIVTQMFKYRQRDYLRGWYNTVLGIAHTEGSARLSDAQIDACFTPMRDEPDRDNLQPHWIGIDVGQTCHVILARGNDTETLHCVRFMTVPVDNLIDTVEELLAGYNVIGGACDRHPYTPTADALNTISQGRIVPVEYRGSKELNLIKDEIDPEIVSHAQANRTMLIDDVARLVRLGRIKFSGYNDDKTVITEHLKDMVRDETPEQPATWKKLTGNDHYFHAAAFLVAGLKIKSHLLRRTSEVRTTVGIAAPLTKFRQERLL